jgi:hypothetical protein
VAADGLGDLADGHAFVADSVERRTAGEAIGTTDAWTGFCAYAERVCSMQAADRGPKDVLTSTLPNAKNLEARRTRG